MSNINRGNFGAAYNEIDSYCVAWLRNLIQRELIAPGVVLECSITDLRPADLRGFTQVHFFAGIGVWSRALRDAGVADTEPVWTWSEPCQPFSAAGKGLGFADERYLRPFVHHFVKVLRPVRCFGEQVASKDGLAWLDVIQSDMEGEGYAFGAVDTCSAGFGAPHIRQRLYWTAERLADAGGSRLEKRDCIGRIQPGTVGPSERKTVECISGACGLADAHGRDTSAEGLQRGGEHGQQPHDASPGDGCDRPGPTNGFWSTCDWLLCRDDKWRSVEPGTFPLAHGATSRVGRLRAYGNAINLAQATEFVKACAK